MGVAEAVQHGARSTETDLGCILSADGPPERLGSDVAQHLVRLGVSLRHLQLVQVAHQPVKVVVLVKVEPVLHLYRK